MIRAIFSAGRDDGRASYRTGVSLRRSIAAAIWLIEYADNRPMTGFEREWYSIGFVVGWWERKRRPQPIRVEVQR